MSGLVVCSTQAGEELLAVVGSETFLASLPPSVAVAMQNLHHKRSMHGHLHSPRIELVLYWIQDLNTCSVALWFGWADIIRLLNQNRKVIKFGE